MQDDTATTLPGEDFDAWPNPGDVLAVAGVAFDEELVVRELPGSSQTQVAALAPTATGIPATGEARTIDGDGLWYEVTADGVTGWADGTRLKYEGPTQDATATIISGLGETPSASSMLELGKIVADHVAGDDGDVPPRVVVVVAPVDAATGTVTYDVVGFADDSIAGARLLVTGQQELVPTALRRAFVYKLLEVRSTTFCERGGSPDTVCL